MTGHVDRPVVGCVVWDPGDEARAASRGRRATPRAVGRYSCVVDDLAGQPGAAVDEGEGERPRHGHGVRRQQEQPRHDDRRASVAPTRRRRPPARRRRGARTDAGVDPAAPTGRTARTGCRLAWTASRTPAAPPPPARSAGAPTPSPTHGAVRRRGGWHAGQARARDAGARCRWATSGFCNRRPPDRPPRAPSVTRHGRRRPRATSCSRAATRRPPCPDCWPRCPTGFSVIVVDNGSRDATADVARDHGARVVSEPRPGYGAAVHAGVEAATSEFVAVMDGDGSFDPAELPPLLGGVAGGRCGPGARAPSPGLGAGSGRGTPAPATLWSSGGCAGRSASRCTTSRRCGCAAARTCSTSTCRTDASATRSSCCAAATLAGWRLEEHDVPTARARRAPAPRSAAACAVRCAPPATSGGCSPMAGGRTEGAGGRQGARARAREDPPRRPDRHGDGGRDRRGRAPRHPRDLPRDLRASATWPWTATSTTPSRAARSGDALAGWTVHPQRGEDFGERLGHAHADAAGPGPACRSAWTPRSVTGATCGRSPTAAEGGDAVLGPATDGGWWVLALERRDGGARPDRRTDVAARHVRAHPGRARREPARRCGWPRCSATSTPWPTRRRWPARSSGGHFARPGGGSVAMTDAAAGERLHARPQGHPCTVWDGDGAAAAPDRCLAVRRERRRPACSATARDRPSTSAAGPAGWPRRWPAAATRCSGSTSCPRRSGRPATRGVAALLRDVFDPVPGEGRWETALLADGNIGIGGDPVALLERVRHAGRPGRPGRGRSRTRGTGVVARHVRLETSARPQRAVPVDPRGGRRRRGRAARRRAAVRRHRARRRAWAVIEARREDPVVRTPASRRADFTSRLRSPAVTARVGLWLGLCFGIAFVTGLVSHWAQTPPPAPLPDQPQLGLPGHPGSARHRRARPRCRCCWSSCGRSTRAVRRGRRVSSRDLVGHGLERASIAVLVAAAVFQLVTGLANAAQWYPWRSPSGRPTTPWPGWRSARCWCTSR